VQPTHRVYAPPLPPAAPTPTVPICPVNTHLCAANGRQPRVFCDVDPDCYGDNEYCFGSNVPNGCPEKKGCCVQEPTEGPQPHGWVPPQAGDPQLSPAVCERLLRDPGHLFRRMWGIESRDQNQHVHDACYTRDRAAGYKVVPTDQFFEDVFSGRYCQSTDWYEGATFAHGWFDAGANASAVLGFDWDIHAYCDNDCDKANLNMLALFGSSVHYNTCRNFEWQMCAVRGLLLSQSSRQIVFARAPKTVSMDGWPPFGHCSGFTDNFCDEFTGFANDDIFYLEVCLFSQICRNSDQLFEVDVGQPFVCDVSPNGFAALKRWLLEEPHESVRMKLLREEKEAEWARERAEQAAREKAEAEEKAQAKSDEEVQQSADAK